MDTLGSLIDKLCTIDMKMWNNQEMLYEIRKMTFEEFRSKYFIEAGGDKNLWACLKKACDLNLQRNQLIDEIDLKVIEIAREALKDISALDDGRFIQRKHKTY